MSAYVRIQAFRGLEAVRTITAPRLRSAMRISVGTVSVGAQRYTLGPRDIFVIQPYVIHATEIERCDGRQYNIKVSLEALCEFLNLKNVFAFDNASFESLPPRLDPDNYDRLSGIIKTLIAEDDNIFARMRCILLFRMPSEQRIFPYSASTGTSTQIAMRRIFCASSSVRPLQPPISLDEAASQLHMNRYYFCKYFKRVTNLTFVKYLNQVRMFQAAMMVLEGRSVTNCCYECGFSSLSYFVHLFKETYGHTPTEYRLVMCPPADRGQARPRRQSVAADGQVS